MHGWNDLLIRENGLLDALLLDKGFYLHFFDFFDGVLVVVPEQFYFFIFTIAHILIAGLLGFEVASGYILGNFNSALLIFTFVL